MRILIIGGLGMVGHSLTDTLRRQGHEVTVSSRRANADGERVQLDLAALPAQEALAESLHGFDVLINAAGVGPSAREARHWLLHHEAACRLFDACVVAGVSRVIQVSALGDPATGSFIASKHAADAYLMKLPLQAIVVRPSLIFSCEGESTQLLLMLARLPLQALPDAGEARVQPLHVDDLAEVIAGQLGRGAGSRIVEVAGPRVLTMATYVQTLRRALGGKRAWQLPLPAWLAKLGFAALGLTRSSLGGLQTLRVLREGSVTSSVDALFAPRDPTQFLGAQDVLREHASFSHTIAIGLGRLALAAVCAGSALLPLLAFEHARPLDWLARMGMHGAMAHAAFAALIATDLACAVAALFARSARAWTALALVFVGYTLTMSVFMPELWLDPFGPLLKNISLIAWVGALALLDSTHQRTQS